MSVTRPELVHDVLFAETDDELGAVGGARLAHALATGSIVILIATPGHRRLFLDRIGAAGIDPEDARADGRLLLFDAAETLDRFTPGGAFDRAAFDDVVGSLVRQQTERGPVLAFGEMVGLLFDEGRAEQAIELEAAWDELLQETSARLLCSYRGDLLDDPRSAPYIGSVCSIHSTVVTGAPFRRTWTFTDRASSGSDARRLTANALRARGVPEDAFYDTLSVVTELVGNAVLHGDCPVSLEVTIDDDRVTVGVGDGSTAAPVVRSERRKLGRGLHLVEELARAWGFETRGAGKVVWAEVAR